MEKKKEFDAPSFHRKITTKLDLRGGWNSGGKRKKEGDYDFSVGLNKNDHWGRRHNRSNTKQGGLPV